MTEYVFYSATPDISESCKVSVSVHCIINHILGVNISDRGSLRGERSPNWLSFRALFANEALSKLIQTMLTSPANYK